MGYNTKQREMIYALLTENPERHFTVDGLFLELLHRDVAVGKTTIYRFLDKLCAEGIVRKYVAEENAACYQFIQDAQLCKEHFHLKCSVCGQLIHLECDFLREICGHIHKAHAFSVDSSKTVFYGKCSACQACANEEAKQHEKE